MSDPANAVAAVGMNCRLPGANSPEEFWRNIRAGVESVSTFSIEELRAAGVDARVLDHPNFVPRGGVIEDIDQFDPEYFGFSPREAELLDPQQRQFLECAVGALERTGYDPRRFDGLIGVYAGIGLSSYMWNNLYPNESRLADVSQMQLMLSVDKDYLATRTAYKLDLRGPAVTVQSACSTSMTAIHLACQALLTGECDMALAGGVTLILPEVRGYVYEEGGVLSPDGHCRSFDADAKGTVPGSGVGVVVLKRLEDAIADRDEIYAVVRGSAMNNDGAAKVGYTAPSPRGQAQVISDALVDANVEVESIGYIETHGAATPLGDPIEVAALTEAFRAMGAADKHTCAIGSLKSNVGHLDSAAGVAAFIKCAMIVRNGEIPPSLHFETPNPNIDFDSSPFFVNTELRQWPDDGQPRRAGMSSFGIGGTNVHIVIEEPPALERATPERGDEQAVIISARTPTALDSASERLAEHLAAHPELDLVDVAATMATGRAERPYRRVAIGSTLDEISTSLRDGSGAVYTGADRAGDRSVVFMFSGVGDQYPGMARELYRDEPVFRAELDQCAEELRRYLEVDVREVLFDTTQAAQPAQDPFARMLAQRVAGPLDETANAQTLMFATQYALAKLWMSYGVTPAALVGYSIGEYVAACLAGVMSLPDALRLVAHRALAITELPAGSMLAVMAGADEIRPLLGDRLSLSAVDGPALCVVAGPPEDVEALSATLSDRGTVTRAIPTTHAFHSWMMRPLEERLRADAAACDLQPPRIPFLSNVTGTWITADQAIDPGYWASHVHSTVRFGDAITEVWRLLAPVVVEMGPGQSLGSLLMQSRERPANGLVLSGLRAVHDDASDRHVLLSGLSRAWLAGVPVDWNAVYASREPHRVVLPTSPFERRRCWIDVPTAAAGADVERRVRTGRQRDPKDWFYLPAWQPSLPPDVENAEDQGALLVIAEPDTVPARIAAGWRGRVVTVVPGERFVSLGENAYELAPGELADWLSLVRALVREGGVPGRIVHGLAAPNRRLVESSPERPRTPTTEVLRPFHSLLYLARALSECRVVDEIELCVLSAHGQPVSGESQVIPEHGMLAGLCRVIPQEMPQVRCRHIDIAVPTGEWRADRLAESLRAEVVGGTEPSVAYRGEQRFVEDFAPVSLPDHDAGTGLKRGGRYLIVGGLGRVGQVIARYLATHAGARIGVIRRTPVPPRADWDTYLASAGPDDIAADNIRVIRELETLGAEVVTATADVADRESFAAAVAHVEERIGPLDGVFHVAGVVTADSVIPVVEGSEATTEPHLAAKVRGLSVLADVLGERQLDFVSLASSIAALLGGIGLAAYAAANSYLGLFAHQQSQVGPTRWSALAWEGWSMEEEGASTLREYLIDDDDATDILRRLLAGALPPRLVNSTGDLRLRLDQWVNRSAARDAEQAVAASAHPRPALQTTYVAPGTETEKRVAAVWQRMLGIEEIGTRDSFFELGGHSLLATRVVAALLAEMGVQVQLHTLLSKPTIADLARAVDEASNAKDAAPVPAITRVNRDRYRKPLPGGTG